VKRESLHLEGEVPQKDKEEEKIRKPEQKQIPEEKEKPLEQIIQLGEK
jgi:hypothetical protein